MTTYEVDLLTKQCPALGRADITITRVAPRKLDDDNCIAGCKPIRDGVADAFGLRDNDPRLSFWYAQERGKPKEYGITITIDYYV